LAISDASDPVTGFLCVGLNSYIFTDRDVLQTFKIVNVIRYQDYVAMSMVNAIFAVMKSIKITGAPHQKWRKT